MEWMNWENFAYLMVIILGAVGTMVATKYRIVVKELKEVAAKYHEASKDGKIPKRFGKLRAVAGGFFGDIAIQLEYLFMAPDLVAGDIEGALRSSTAGLFGAGKVDLAKLPPGEGKKYIRHTNAITNFLKNYQSKLMAEERLKNLKPGDEEQFVASDQLAQAEKNMADIGTNYRAFGYNNDPGEQGKVKLQHKNLFVIKLHLTLTKK